MRDGEQQFQSGRGAGIREVARRAGVSPATASRSLRGNPSVSAATRDRVLAAARELAYSLPRTPDHIPLIGVLARFPSQWYFAEAISAIEQTLAPADHRMVLHNIGGAENRRRFFERVLPLGQLDGIVVVSSSFDPVERAALDRTGLPITVVGGYVPGRPGVGIDEEAAARVATQHLIGLGHRDIGLISFDPNETVGLATTRARRHGFDAALADAGLRERPEWIVIADGSRMAGGVTVAEQLLTQPRLPTALFAMSDELAIGALQALRRAGLSVPGHVSVVGFDDHEMAAYMDLTTIAQPVREQAREATRLLLDGATGDDRQRSLPVRLVVRGTTGPAA
ncbi:LacI family DNA-binding transcriptional regulator [Microlunatus ginsengisoli]|uniref:LacI family DNA-binding transcriptional regulator n=1 Tax=Microlunatus ginsengisoli TaxID=363863 RepID=A0ABP7ARI8_9ACTN